MSLKLQPYDTADYIDTEKASPRILQRSARMLIRTTSRMHSPLQSAPVPSCAVLARHLRIALRASEDLGDRSAMISRFSGPPLRGARE
jgi:hypothetical protein